jgi:hypothetical protein
MRRVGDPLADGVIRQLFEQGGISRVNELMQKLVDNDGMPPAHLPEVVRDYLASTSGLPALESTAIEQGEQLFARLGPEMLVVLGFYGLPMDYAAGKGVRVLHRTAYLAERPMRRVLETTQMVIDVMAPGGLGPHGRGLRAAQKVRLMHAAVRHLLTHDRDASWNTAELGVPINQEDMAGTLMTFGYIVLAGLERLGIAVSEAEREAYFQCWTAIGRVMGVREELIPANISEGRTLARAIFKDQGRASREGQQLAQALLRGYQSLLPEPFDGVPASMMHFFLESESLTGRNIAQMLGIPRPDWTLDATELAVALGGFLSKHGIANPLTSHIAGVVGRELIEGFICAERGGSRVSFSIPVDLHALWAGRGAAAR